MKKVICRVLLVLAVASLVGCGLKGPLYFPPQEQPKKPIPPVTKPAASKEQQQSTTTATGLDGQPAQ